MKTNYIYKWMRALLALLLMELLMPISHAVAGTVYYLEYISPLSDSAFNRYSRMISVPVLKGTVNLQTWLFDAPGGAIPCYPNRLCSATVFSEMPTVWLTLDGVRISGPLNNPYQMTLDTTKYSEGSHILSAEIRSNEGASFVAVPLEVVIDNVPGAAPGAQKIPVCTTKFDVEFNGYGTRGCEWITYPGTPTFGRALPYKTPRTATPLTSVPKTSDMWAEKIASSVHRGWLSRFYLMPGGHVTTRSRQNYFYNDLNQLYLAEIDGPRNVGALGFPVAGHVGDDGAMYLVTSNGRFVEIELDGSMKTIAGWRVKLNQLPPYWGSTNPAFGSAGTALQNAQYESVGNFVDGPAYLHEPWDVAIDPKDPEIWYLTDTLNHRIVKVSEHTDPATVTTFAGSVTKQAGYRDGNGKNALFNEPWNLVMDKSGNLYVSDRLNHAIRKIDPAGNVTTIVKSSATPPLVVDENAKRAALPPAGKSLTDMRTLYMIDGVFGQATLAYPEGLRFDSAGRLIVADGLTRVLRRIDLSAKRIDFLRNVPSDTDMNTHNININMDDGSCGGKDDILVATFAQGGPWRVKADGSSYAAIYDQTNTVNAFEGRANNLHTQTYPWLAVCGHGATWVSGISEGLFRLTLAKPTDPTMNQAAYLAGQKIFYDGTVANFPDRPGFHLRHSVSGQDQYGGETMEELGMRTDADIKAIMQSGWGGATSRPEITGRDLDNLLYFIHWNCTPCIAAGKTAVPAATTDTVAPVISNVQVAQATPTSVRVSWTTNETAIGFVNFGKNTGYGNTSAVETAYATQHQAVIQDLVPGVAYHFQVRAKDVAGNQSVSSDVVLTVGGVTDTVAPTTPAGLAATVVSNSVVNLTWSSSSDNSGIAGYRIYRNGLQVATVATTNYSDAALAGGTTYSYAVAAYDAVGNTSAKSAAVNAKTTGVSSGGTTTPTTSTSYSYSLAVGSVRSVVAGQSVTTAVTATAVSGASPAVSFSVNGLPAGVTGSYSALSCTPTCTSTLTLQTTTSASPGNYTVTAVARTPALNRIVTFTLTITAPSTSTVSLSAGKRIRVTANTEVRALPSLTTTAIPATLLPNLQGTQVAGVTGTVIGGPKTADGYTWWNIDYDSGADGWSTSPSLQLATADTTAPSLPTGLTATAVSANQVNLQWTRGTDNVAAGVVFYDIFRNGVQIGTTASTNYQDGGLSANVSYSYTVRARDFIGNNSLQTAAVKATTPSVALTSPLDSIPPGTWYQAPNSKIADIQFQWPSSVFLGSGPPRYFTESSGAYDSRRNRFIIFGGGHNDYAGNEIYTFDLNTLTWRRETEPYLLTDPRSVVETSGYYPDANGNPNPSQPRSRHTYDSVAYVPTIDSFCAFGMFAAYPAAKGSFNTDCFNFTTKKWERKVDVPSAGQSLVAMAKFDPATSHVFYFRGAAPLSEYDPVANKWTQRSAADIGYFYDTTAIIDTKRHRFVAMGLNQFIWYDLNASGTLVQNRVETKLTGATEILKARRPGFAYDSTNDVYVAWSGETADLNGDGVVDVNLPPENVYIIDPDTLVAKKITPAATNAVKPKAPFPLSNGASNATFSRFAYIPSKNLFILVNNWTTENVFFYKLDPNQVRSSTTTVFP